MSSRVFAAKSSHRADDPQLCGLCDLTGCEPIVKGETCLYLTCLGEHARPSAQIERGTREDGYASGFRTVPSGKKRLVSVGTSRERLVPVFKWQQRGDGDQWHDVIVWERLVHSACAAEAGYRVSGERTEAIRGRRTQGHAHMASAVPEAPIMELARIMAEPFAGTSWTMPGVTSDEAVASANEAVRLSAREELIVRMVTDPGQFRAAPEPEGESDALLIQGGWKLLSEPFDSRTEGW